MARRKPLERSLAFRAGRAAVGITKRVTVRLGAVKIEIENSLLAGLIDARLMRRQCFALRPQPIENPTPEPREAIPNEPSARPATGLIQLQARHLALAVVP